MKNSNYTITITVPQSPEKVFDAITNVRGWWSGEIDGETDKLGAEFTYRYQDFHRSKQKIVEFVPSKKIVWEVVESHQSFVKQKDEWKGTKIQFEISEKKGSTQLKFTHVGLVPAFECYSDCAGAWGSLITDNLRQLIATGKGQPNAFKEKPDILPTR